MFLFSLLTVHSHLCRATPHLQSVTIVCENWSHGQCSINTSISNNTKSPPHHTTPRYTTPHHNPSIHPPIHTHSLTHTHTHTHWLELEHNHTKHIQHTKQNKNNNRVYIIIISLFSNNPPTLNPISTSSYTHSQFYTRKHTYIFSYTSAWINSPV